MILKNGDCIEEMQKLIDDGVQVDSVVTDPPYHLTSIVDRFGKKGSAKPKDKDGLYNRIDKGFMKASVEPRCPFLNLEVVNFLFPLK